MLKGNPNNMKKKLQNMIVTLTCGRYQQYVNHTRKQNAINKT
jgi:hypothetical protein